MSARASSQRLVRRIAATSALTIAGGGMAYSLKSRSSELQQPALTLHRDASGTIIPPTFAAPKSRADHLADLRAATTSSPSPSLSSPALASASSASSSEPYDLLVIGGGATGTGIALDAATRGLRVALVERADFASGTSSKSTKLVHGGVRYLEKAVWELDWAQFQLVREALRERKTFLTTAPHLSGSLPIMLPVSSWWMAPYFWAGTKAYDLLAGSKGLESGYWIGKKAALEAFPLLRGDGLKGALIYYDGQHNDSRMNVGLAMTAAAYGATVVNYIEVTGLEKDASGKVCGAVLRDVIASREAGEPTPSFTVRAKGVINATGPFSDAIEKMDDPQRKDMVAPSSGVHVVLPARFGPTSMGVLDPSTSDGRVIFFLPWQGRMIAGTTDLPCGIEPDPVAGDDDIGFVLKEVQKFLSPDVKLSRDDVLATWSGIRPLVRDPHSKNTSSLVRSHLVTVSPAGLLTCAGGKWTTYRQMAEDAVDAAIAAFGLRPGPVPTAAQQASLPISDLNQAGIPAGACQTHHIRILGAHGYTAALPAQLEQRHGLPADVAAHLAASYGDRAWAVIAAATADASLLRLAPAFPMVEAEVRYCVQAEMAQTAADVLARRTRLSFLDAQAARAALPRVVDIMAAELGWGSRRCEAETRAGLDFLGSMGVDWVRGTASREDTQRAEEVEPQRLTPVARVVGRSGAVGTPSALLGRGTAEGTVLASERKGERGI